MFRMDWNSESGEVKRNLRKDKIAEERQRWGKKWLKEAIKLKKENGVFIFI